MVWRGVADEAEDVGDGGTARDMVEIPLQRTWRPLAVAVQDSIFPHSVDKPVCQEPGSPLMQPQQQHRDRATPNPVKQYNNWNVCYSCGFDVEDRHTSMTCHFCKPMHQTRFK